MTARTGRTAIALALLAAALWLALDALRPKADWVRMECATQAIPGRPFPVRVHLTPPVPAGNLGIGFHGRDVGSRNAVMMGGSRITLLPDVTSYSLEIPLRAAVTAHVVRAVLYLTPSGAWKDRSRSALSSEIPVAKAQAGQTNATPTLAPVQLENQGVAAIIPRVRSQPMRIFVVVLWSIAALLAWSHPRPTQSSGPNVHTVPTRSLGIATAAAAVVEAVDLSRWLGDSARAAARQLSAYDAREPGQQIAAALLLAGAAIAATHLLRSRLPPPIRVAWAALAVALGLVGLDSLSLHAVDEIAESMRWGIPRIQFAHLLCALTATIAIALDRSRRDG